MAQELLTIRLALFKSTGRLQRASLGPGATHFWARPRHVIWHCGLEGVTTSTYRSHTPQGAEARGGLGLLLRLGILTDPQNSNSPGYAAPRENEPHPVGWTVVQPKGRVTPRSGGLSQDLCRLGPGPGCSHLRSHPLPPLLPALV